MRPAAEPAWYTFACCHGQELVWSSTASLPLLYKTQHSGAVGLCTSRAHHVMDFARQGQPFNMSLLPCLRWGSAAQLRVCHQGLSSAFCRAPKALINTCIRHAHSNLGIDLSSCSQWMRFLDVHYQRPAVTMTPPAMETSEVRISSFCLS